MAEEWPKDGKPADFEGIISALREAVLFAYQLVRQNEGKDIPWTGLDIGRKEKAACLSPDERLWAENLARDKDQGRDPLDAILAIAVQLGIEQGRRIVYDGELASIRELVISLELQIFNLRKRMENK